MPYRFGLMLILGMILFPMGGARAEGDLSAGLQQPVDLAQLLDEVLPQADRAVADLAPAEGKGTMSAQTMRAKVSPAEDGRLLVQALFGVESKTAPIKVEEAVKQQTMPNLMTAPILVAPPVETKTVMVEVKK